MIRRTSRTPAPVVAAPRLPYRARNGDSGTGGARIRQMTALAEYARLESTGIWRPSPEAQRQDVIVSIGQSSLVIADMADTALAHWSLPAVIRRNPGQRPALFAPGEDALDELELDDDAMIEAIERVRSAVERRRPRQGRLRLGLVAGLALLAAGAAAAFWLPDALIRRAVSAAPFAIRADIGAGVLDQIERLTGPACNAPEARAALTALRDRVLGAGAGRLVVLPNGIAASTHLPGGLILIGRDLIEDYDGPEPVAGYILAEDARRRAEDPLERLLRFGGAYAAARLLTTGEVPPDLLRDYAAELLTAPAAAVSAGTLLPRFETADVSARPFAETLPPAAPERPVLIAGDPRPQGETVPILSDGAWVRLQGICGE